MKIKNIVLGLFLCNSICLAIDIQKVYHHKIAVDKTQALTHIELGKIVLYCAQEPIVKKGEPVASVYKKGFVDVIYFLPMAQCASQEVKQMIGSLNAANQESYTASMRAVQKPAPGMEIKISYDPKKVMIEYDFFDAITKAKGLEFRLYNKSLLDTLKEKSQPVLRTSHADKPIVIIDCGHGGHDSGTIGFFNTVEKDITLAMGKQLAKDLQANGIRVLLTRNDDRFIGLDERTYIANQCKGNAILISLHVNNAPRKEVHGLETFCLASNLFKAETVQLATAIDILIQESDAARYNQSKKLADHVHNAILASMEKNGFDVPDRKVRNAATQVLMGIKWPGILLEMDYASNERSARQFSNPKYTPVMCQAICNGVTQFYENSKINSTGYIF